MEAISMLLAFVAGLFSVLSPCVLPLVPIVLGAAVAEHKLGPVALAVGLALSFTAIGMFVATIGYTIGLDGDVFRWSQRCCLSWSGRCWSSLNGSLASHLRRG